jgi:hypothetical protein
MEWKNGELASYSLKSENKTEITVFYRGEAKKIILD